jgi:uncharacterized caspase-like protein
MTNQKIFRTLLVLPLIFFFIVPNVSIGEFPASNRNNVVGHAGNQGTRYALLIGVNEYENEGNEKRAKDTKRPFFNLKNLRYCCNDMTVLKETLIDTKFTTSENIVLLTSNADKSDQKSTITNINRELKYLFGRAESGDTIFIAFAGHGLVLPDYKGDEKSELYLCPMDAEIICDSQTGKFDCRQLLSRKDIEVSLKECQASVKIFAMDACRNRDVQTRSIAQSDLMTKAAQNEISKIKEFIPIPVEGLFQLFSCDEGQTAAESEEKKHGIYSYFLIEGLRGAANSNGDGNITLSELQRYVKYNTINHAKGVLSHDQTPKIIAIGDSTGEEVILAACTPKAISEPQSLSNNNQSSYSSLTGTSNNNSNNNNNTQSRSNNVNRGGNSGNRNTR